MGDTERVVTRQEPITVKVQSIKRTFKAKPLFWRTRADFGTAVASEYSHSNSPMVPQIIRDADEGSHLEYRLSETDWEKLLGMAYPDEPTEAWEDHALDIWDIIELVKVALEVNGLERLAYMVDPRLKDPLDQALERALAQGDGLKTPSTTDASLPESIPTPSPVETAPLG